MPKEIQSSIVQKCVVVLDALAHAQGGLTYSDVVAETGFTKSSAHRVLSILLSEGLVMLDDVARTYSLGPKPVSWARAAWQKTDLQQIADTDLVQLRDETGLNVAVSILSGDAVLFIRTMNLRNVRYAAQVGEEASLHATAAGKLFLAYSDDRDALIGKVDLEQLTEHTLVTRDALSRDIEETRTRGFAICNREEFLQISGIAAPVFDYQGRILAAISLWAPAKLASHHEVVAQSPALLRWAQVLTARFGGPN